MTRSQKLRSKAAQALRDGRKDRIVREQPIWPVFLALAGSYKRLAALDRKLTAWRVLSSDTLNPPCFEPSSSRLMGRLSPVPAHSSAMMLGQIDEQEACAKAVDEQLASIVAEKSAEHGDAPPV